ncbi:TPA: putative Ig domain-containing protein, partial [Streptococcus suis]|nr:putative Ig domain-containing protein [Streptococcus suis]
MTRRQKRKKQLRHQQLKSAAFAAATVASLTFTSPQAIKAEELKTTAKNPEVESKSVVENPLESAQTMEFVEEGAASAISEAPSQETPVVASETSSTEDSKPATSVTYTVEYRDKSGQLVHQVIKTAIIAEGQDSVTVTENAIELVNDEALANYYDETGESLTRTATITRGGTATISYTVSSFEDPSKETVSTPQRDVTVNYDVVYTEAGLEVYRETRSHTFKTYDTVGSTSVVVSPDLTATELQGYALSADSSATQVLNLTEGQSHQVTFEVKGASKERDTRKVDYNNGDTDPYLTLENYTENYKGNDNVTLKSNGNTVDFVYKIGFTRIAADDLELSEDAQKLGMTLDTTEGYIRGSVVIDASKVGSYKIGFQSKTNPTVRAVATVTINPHVGFTLENTAGTELFNNYWQRTIPVQGQDFQWYRANARGESWEDIENLDGWPENTARDVDGVWTPYHYLGYKVNMIATPFGYTVGQGETVANATSSTEQYLNVIPISARDLSQEFNNQGLALTIADFEVIETSPDVEVSLLDVRTKDLTGTYLHYKDATQANYSYATMVNSGGYYVQNTPYYLQFTKLPATQADDLYVKFRIVDNLGLEKFFKVEFSTFESSLGGALSNADVKFTGSSTYLNEANNTVQIPISNDEQVLGTVVLNKENAWVKSVSLPIGTKLVATKTDSEGRALEANVVKEAGTKLNPGKYTFEVKAVDGHFGDNAPNRVFTFEVTDAINPIPHQVWTEGTKPDAIPVSMEMGSTIADIRIENGGDYAYLEGNSADSTISIYGLKRTTSNQTARVYVKYLNGDGTTTETFTDFTYEVLPAPDNDLQVSVTNDVQTVVEGGTWLDMVITHTEGATLKVDTSKLPKGTRYNASTKTISGIGRYEGTYDVPIIVEKDGVVKGTFVHLVVTPGTFEVPDETIEVTVLDKDTVLGFKDLPDGSKVTYTGYSYEIERGDTGFVVSDDKTKITGVPTRVGSYYVNATVSKVASNGLVRTDTATLTIKVKGIKPSLEVTNAEQTLDVGTAIQDIQITKDDYSNLTVDTNSLPSGVSYNPSTGIISGTPNQVGNYRIRVYTQMPDDYSSDLSWSDRYIEKYITLNVTPLHPSLTVSSEEQTFSSVTDMTPVTLENDARSTINVSNLPDGVRYDEGTKTISGRPTNGVGDYTITVTASMPYALGGEVVTKTVKLHVTAVAPSIDATNDHQTVTAKDAIATIQVSKDAYSTMAEPYVLLNDGRQVSLSEIGLRYDNDAKTITGTPTVVGTHTIKLSTELERKLGGGTANKDVTLVVNEIPMSLDIANQEQTKIVMSAIDPVILTVPADTTITVDEGSLPPGVRYNADTKTFEG